MLGDGVRWRDFALSPSVGPMVALSGTRYRNFDALRLIAAGAVIFSHSFAITEGSEDNEWLVRLLGPGNILGIYGVFTFFAISGFLVTRSFHESRDLVSYLCKRCLRIFPGLILCAVLMAFLLGPLATALQPGGYLASRSPYSYLVKTVLLFDTSSRGLPGVAFSGNDYGTIVNGSLWSLGPEFLCYLGVIAFAFAGLARPIGAALALALGLWTQQAGLLGNFGFAFAYFAAGMLIYYLMPRTQSRRWVDALALIVLVARPAAIPPPPSRSAAAGSSSGSA
jgi:peptidoglycan/LPS O-acetylase OafA/YrhL